MIRALIAISIAFTFAGIQKASAETPINVSLIPDIALAPKTEHVKGFILGVWSENPQTALALGIVNGSTGNSKGFSFAFGINYADNYTGVHLAILNWAKQEFKGLQWGTVNIAKKLTGVQLGLVNYAESVDTGVQIGLVNVIKQTQGWFTEFPEALAPAFILVNWRF